jgi:hypothetical protein
MDVPISAMILSLIGAIALGKIVVSVLAFVAETFFFSGESVSRRPLLNKRQALAHRENYPPSSRHLVPSKTDGQLSPAAHLELENRLRNNSLEPGSMSA